MYGVSIMKLQTAQLISISLAVALIAVIFSHAADAAAPTINTGNAIVNGNFVTLRGTVDPNGEATVAWFIWGPESSGGSRSTNGIDVGSGDSQVDYGYILENLDYNTTYTYQAVARGKFGVTPGTKRTFSTLVGPGFSNVTTNQTGTAQTQGITPIVITNIATNVTDKTVHASGTVIPGTEILSSGWFEWGTTKALGNATEKRDRGISKSVTFRETIHGLSAGTTYYFRAVGKTQYGTAHGGILSFRTKENIIAQPMLTKTAEPQFAQKEEPAPEPACICDEEPKGEITQEAFAFRGLLSTFPGNIIAWLLVIILLLTVAYISLHVYEKIQRKSGGEQQPS